MPDPIDIALTDLNYLRARLDAMRRLAVDPVVSQAPALRQIAKECELLLAKVAQIRKTLDPESTS